MERRTYRSGAPSVLEPEPLLTETTYWIALAASYASARREVMAEEMSTAQNSAKERGRGVACS